jgi:AraC-like DNA-binding protein
MHRTLRLMTRDLGRLAGDARSTREQEALVRAAYARFVDYTPLVKAPGSFRFERDAAAFCGLTLVRYVTGPATLIRWPDDVRMRPVSGYLLGYSESAVSHLETERGEAWSVPGDTLVCQVGRSLTYRTFGGASLLLWISEDEVEAFTGGASIHGAKITGPMSILFGEHLRQVLREAMLTAIRPDIASHVATSTRRLAGALILQNPDAMAAVAPQLNAALLQRVRGLIDDTLFAADLTPEWLASEIGISRRKLYSLFEPTGGVARYILNKRLDRTRTCLAAPGPPSVKQVAFGHGFASESQFSRAFKQRYACSPRELATVRCSSIRLPDDASPAS